MTTTGTLFPTVDQDDAAVTIPPLTQSMYEMMACPASYQARVIHKIPSPSNEFAKLGQEIHAIMAAYVAHLKESGREEDWTFFEGLLKYVGAEAQGILRGVIGKIKFDPRSLLFTEERFNYPDASGQPDLITFETPRDATVWDYKNYYEIVEADTFQSKLYPLLLFRYNQSLESVKFVLVFTRYGVTREVTWKREQVPHLESVLAEARARQQNIHELEGLAEAVPGRACDYCPLLTNGRCQMNSVNPRAQMCKPERLLYAIFLKAALKSTLAILHEEAREMPVTATDANGTVYEAKFELAQKRTLPLLPTVDVLNKHFMTTGEDLLKRATVSMTSLNSLRSAKKRAALDGALKAVESAKDITRFKLTNNTPDENVDDEG